MTTSDDYPSHDIRIGAVVVGTDGRLGEVHRVIVDANLRRATNVIVRHGTLLTRDERVIPLKHVHRIDADGTLHLDMDERDFRAMDRFVEDRYRVPDAGFSAPAGMSRADYLLDAIVASGPTGALTDPPSPLDEIPHGRVRTEDVQQTALTTGMEVVDALGEKVGQIGALSVDPDTGAPSRITLRRGVLLKHDVEIPAAWVQDVSDEGVVLRMPAARIDELDEQRE